MGCGGTILIFAFRKENFFNFFFQSLGTFFKKVDFHITSYTTKIMINYLKVENESKWEYLYKFQYLYNLGMRKDFMDTKLKAESMNKTFYYI